MFVSLFVCLLCVCLCGVSYRVVSLLVRVALDVPYFRFVLACWLVLFVCSVLFISFPSQPPLTDNDQFLP